MSALGQLKPDALALILCTGFSRFESPVGICGLAKVDETRKRLEILACDSVRPGNGHFKKFIELCKEEFSTVCIWHVTSEILISCLPRYGFRPWQEKQICHGEWELVDGYRWDK